MVLVVVYGSLRIDNSTAAGTRASTVLTVPSKNEFWRGGALCWHELLRMLCLVCARGNIQQFVDSQLFIIPFPSPTPPPLAFFWPKTTSGGAAYAARGSYLVGLEGHRDVFADADERHPQGLVWSTAFVRLSQVKESAPTPPRPPLPPPHPVQVRVAGGS